MYDDLARRYAEPHRRYHGWNHLRHCIGQFDRVRALAEDPGAVEIALWFHDAVYVPGAQQNERRSAELFRSAACGQFLDTFVDRVCAFTLLTRHAEAPREPDGRLVVDIDLSSLALGWEAFQRDSANIRDEQRAVPDSEFYPAQARFLNSLLNRPRIFHSEFFHDRYEQTARRNIARLLAELCEQGHIPP